MTAAKRKIKAPAKATIRAKASKVKVKKRARRDFPPVHPGEILLKEFLEPMGISPSTGWL